MSPRPQHVEPNIVFEQGSAPAPRGSGEPATVTGRLAERLGISPEVWEASSAPLFNDPADLEVEIGPPDILRSARSRRWKSEGRRRISVVASVAFLVFVGAGLVGWSRVGGAGTGPCPPWDRLDLAVGSSPTGATVFVDGQEVGRTPLRVRGLCRGQQANVRLQSPGHVNWEWRGIVPDAPLARIQADLLRR